MGLNSLKSEGAATGAIVTRRCMGFQRGQKSINKVPLKKDNLTLCLNKLA